MTERIVSPEQLNSRMKVSRLQVWITLSVLTITVIGGLIWFLTREITLEEHHPCFVTDVSMRSDEALYEVFQKSLGDDMYFTIDAVREFYGERVDSFSQIAYMIVDDLEKSEIIEDMTVELGGETGVVVLLPAARSEYAAMTELGIRDEDMRTAGLNPGLAYYLCEVFLVTGDDKPVLEPGMYTANVELDRIDPLRFILK